MPEKLAEVGRFYEPMSRAVGESLAPLSDDQIALVVDLVARMNAFMAS